MTMPMTKHENETYAAELAAVERRARREGGENYYAMDPYRLARSRPGVPAGFVSGYSTPQMLKAADGTPCPYCNETMRRSSKHTHMMPTREHVRPKRAGGTLAQGNCVIVCSRCNNDKGDYMLDEWVAILARRGDVREPVVREFARRWSGGRVA